MEWAFGTWDSWKDDGGRMSRMRVESDATSSAKSDGAKGLNLDVDVQVEATCGEELDSDELGSGANADGAVDRDPLSGHDVTGWPPPESPPPPRRGPRFIDELRAAR